jgi:hypothetical protein
MSKNRRRPLGLGDFAPVRATPIQKDPAPAARARRGLAPDRHRRLVVKRLVRALGRVKDIAA